MKKLYIFLTIFLSLFIFSSLVLALSEQECTAKCVKPSEDAFNSAWDKVGEAMDPDEEHNQCIANCQSNYEAGSSEKDACWSACMEKNDQKLIKAQEARDKAFAFFESEEVRCAAFCVGGGESEPEPKDSDCPGLDELSNLINQLNSYASCMVPCYPAKAEFVTFNQAYAEVTLGCDVPPCCRRSAQKANPDCTSTLISLEAAMDAVCDVCIVPKGVIDNCNLESPYCDRRPPWIQDGSKVEDYISGKTEELKSMRRKCNPDVGYGYGEPYVPDDQENQGNQGNQGNQDDDFNADIPARIKDLPTREELEEQIAQAEELELDWADDGQDTETPGKKTKGKNAYMFVQPGLTDFEMFAMKREMAKWEKQFNKDGYNVIKVEWTEENYKKAFTDSNIGAFDYYGHNGLDTKGSWWSKRLFKLFNRTPAIFGHDADNLKDLIYNAKYEEYVKTMSEKEAHDRAWAEKENLGAEIVNIHACYSADNESLKKVLTKEGGTFRGEKGPYHGFDSLDITTTN